MTYDGAVVRLFVNGVQAGSLPFVGSMVASTGPLRMGGNGIWGEWFAGLIDEVRVYNRALSAREIQQDISHPWPALRRRHRRLTRPAVRAAGARFVRRLVTLSWPAAGDTVDVARYNVPTARRPSGFTPRRRTGSASRPAPATPTLASPPAPILRVTAEDAADNVGAPSAERLRRPPAAAPAAGVRPGGGVWA